MTPKIQWGKLCLSLIWVVAFVVAVAMTFAVARAADPPAPRLPDPATCWPCPPGGAR